MSVRRHQNYQIETERNRIEQFMGEVSDYTWGPSQNVYGPMADPKYPEPTTQLDTTNLIESNDDTYCENGY